ncbi:MULTISPECIES: LysR family transcriptional regulator [Roseomonadaceae]|uniref:LysR family transcriptional regulator n=1 Tax=Falsiroseomonas oleicola TaxID=2801474 RepID=A0ABS6HBM6_9PROT|nr:LysR family transcriptional regulator [Roseomonas oleicola]MBU8546105.1 LysR family transcriptional regulator [Roseomonas oleicola]
MRFDLTDLRLFLATVETGSITRGAERSAMVLASASARIKGMEDALGVPLLLRGRGGVSPTPAGHSLAHHAALVLGQLEVMVGELASYAGGLKGQVRLLANTAAISEFLPDLLGPWLAEHPNIDIDLAERPSHSIVRAVAEGTADAGIVADWANSEGLQLLPFRVDRLVLVLPRGHRLAQRRVVAFEETLDEPFVGLAEGTALQAHLALNAASSHRKPRLRIRLGSFDAVCRLVAGGAGIGVVSDTAFRRCRRSMAISRVALSDSWAERQLGICIRDLAKLPAHARKLVEYLADQRS